MVLVGGTEGSAAGDVVAAAAGGVVAVAAGGVLTAASEVVEGFPLQAELVLVVFKYGAPEVWWKMPLEEEAVIVPTDAEAILLTMEEVTAAVGPALMALL